MVDFSDAAAVLPVCGLDAAVAHYRALGFAVTAYEGGGYAFAVRGSVQLHLAETTDVDPSRSLVSVYLYVDDADALAAEWATSGARGRFVPVTATDYGLREGAHVDPDGNLLRFGSPVRGG